MRRAAGSVVAGLLIVSVATVALAADTPETGTWFDGLEPGVCFDDTFDADGNYEFAVPAAVVPCDEAHGNEVVARIPLGAGEYPASDMIAEVEDLCAVEYEAFLGRPIESTLMSPFSVGPDEADWEAGAHDALCIIYAAEAVLGSAESGSLRAPGETLAVYREVEERADVWLFSGATGEPIQNATDNDLTKLIGTPSWTPDGSSIVYTIGSETAGDGSDVYIVSLMNSISQPLVQGPAKEDSGVFSPDGTTVAFISDADGPEYEIYSRDIASGVTTRLTTFEDKDSTPQWSPDGTRIAFRRRSEGISDIWVMNADGTNPMRLTDNGASNYDPRWSPDGSRLAFTTEQAGNFDIAVMSADGTDQRLLTTHPADDEFPSWSSDGRIIAFHSARHGGVSLWLMRDDGSDQSELTGLAPVGYPMFAP